MEAGSEGSRETGRSDLVAPSLLVVFARKSACCTVEAMRISCELLGMKVILLALALDSSLPPVQGGKITNRGVTYWCNLDLPPVTQYLLKLTYAH